MNDVLLFWVAFWAYLLGMILNVVATINRRSGLWVSARAVMTIGFAAHTVALVWRSIATGHLPLTNLFEYMSLFGWATVLLYVVVGVRLKWASLGALVAGVAFAIIVGASLLPKEADTQLVPALQSYWLQIHVTLAVFGEAAFAVAFATSIAYLVIHSRDSKRGGSLSSSEHLSRLDTLTYNFIKLGYPLFTLGALFAGAVWAQRAWGSFWSWDPKEVGSLIVWLVYTAYLHTRYVRNWRGTGSAVLSVTGFALAIFTLLGSLFLPGLHAY
ncbi:MAG: c-type cytochrome biogenesis protein CcsB [bacterium]